MHSSATCTISWTASPSKYERFGRRPPGVRSSKPAWHIHVCSLSPSLGPIRSVWTENRHDAAGLLGHMHRLVDSKSIETPALRTSTFRRALLRASLSHSYVQSESKSGSNPFSMDRDPLLRAGRLDAPAARSLQHQERNSQQKFRYQRKIVAELMIHLVHWPAQSS